jgi:hypothetical protein
MQSPDPGLAVAERETEREAGRARGHDGEEIAVHASSMGSRNPRRSITVDALALYNLGTMTMVTFRGRSATTREGRVRAALSPK